LKVVFKQSIIVFCILRSSEYQLILYRWSGRGEGVRREQQRHHNGGGEHEKFGIISADSIQVEWWRGRGAPGTAAPPQWEAVNSRIFVILIS
jgi:hypothetical protein